MAHAGTGEKKSDAYATVLLLLELVYPDLDQHRQYRKEHPEFTVERVLRGMCDGVTSPEMNEDERLDALLSTFGSCLAVFNGMEADMLTRLVTALFREPLPQLKAAAARCEAFWRGMFSIISRAHKGMDAGLMGKTTRKVTMVLVLHALACVGRDVPTESRTDLYRTCVKAGIFDVLDEAVEGIIQINGPNPRDDYCRASIPFSSHNCRLIVNLQSISPVTCSPLYSKCSSRATRTRALCSERNFRDRKLSALSFSTTCRRVPEEQAPHDSSCHTLTCAGRCSACFTLQRSRGTCAGDVDAPLRARRGAGTARSCYTVDRSVRKSMSYTFLFY